MQKKGFLKSNRVVVKDASFRDSLISKGFGEKKDYDLILDLNEALYLIENKKISIFDENEKKVSFDKLHKKLGKEGPFSYVVFEDLRKKGFVVKTGLKFGFPFRVYPKGKNPDESHTESVVLIMPQEKNLSMYQFTRASRMASTVNTKLMIAVIGSGNDIVYFEVSRKLF